MRVRQITIPPPGIGIEPAASPESPLDEVREKLRDHVRKERMDAAAKKEVERLRAAAAVAILIPL